MKIICIGLNYLEHVEGLSEKIPDNPVFFLKPETALLKNSQPFYCPDFTENLHCETELVLRIGKVGRSIPQKFAHRYISEIGLGVDFTAKDLHERCRKDGLPWEIAKSFDGSASVSCDFIPFAGLKNAGNINFRLEINEKPVQKGNFSGLIFSFDRIISYVSQFITLKIGDLIFTGTPAASEPVKKGDSLKGFMENNLMLDFDIK